MGIRTGLRAIAKVTRGVGWLVAIVGVVGALDALINRAPVTITYPGQEYAEPFAFLFPCLVVAAILWVVAYIVRAFSEDDESGRP
jgi:hypothetical protein